MVLLKIEEKNDRRKTTFMSDTDNQTCLVLETEQTLTLVTELGEGYQRKSVK